MNQNKITFPTIDILYIGGKGINATLQEIAKIESKKAEKEKNYFWMIFHRMMGGALKGVDNVADNVYINLKEKERQAG